MSEQVDDSVSRETKETTESLATAQESPKVRWFLRFLVTTTYIVVSIFVFIGIAYLVTSDGCPSRNQCTEPDQVIFAVVALIDFVLGFALLFLGMQGRLPGTAQIKSP